MQTPDAHPDDADLSESATLLTAMLERPLTRDEQDRLKRLLQQAPGLAQDLAVVELITLHRACAQIQIGEQPALERYRVLMDGAGALGRVQPQAKRLWRAWFGWLDALLSRPALMGACLAIQFLVIGALLTGQGREHSGERGVAAGGACGPFLLAMDDHLTLGELRRVLMQSGMRIVDGPDAQGRYAIAGADTLQQAQELLRLLSADVRINPECRQKP